MNCSGVERSGGADFFYFDKLIKASYYLPAVLRGCESLYLGIYCPYEILLSELHQLLQHHFCIVQEVIGKVVMRGFLVWRRPEAGFVELDDFGFGVGHEYRGMG